MLFRSKHLAISIGYQITTDCPYGLTIGILRRSKVGLMECPYVFMVHMSFDLPQLLWQHETWRINEPGCVRGMPIQRQGIKSSRWTGREWSLLAIGWYRNLSISWAAP